MKLTRFRFLLPVLLLLLVPCARAASEADPAPVEYRFLPGSGGQYAVVTGGAGAADLVIPARVDGVPVREIERGAFAGNTVLKTLTVEPGVRSVGMHAFEGCASLERVTLPDTLTFVDKDAFRDCAALQAIDMPGIVFAGQVGENAFRGVGLPGLKLAGGVDLADPVLQGETVRFVTRRSGWLYRPLADGSLLIEGCDDVGDTLVIPAELDGAPVSAVAEDAFRGLAGLTRLVLPEGLATVGARAFADCSSLREVVFPASLRSVEPLAFFRTALADPVLPAGAAAGSSLVWYASADRVDASGSWTWNLLADGTAMISGYSGSGPSLVFPDQVDGLPVTALMQEESRFLPGASRIESVKLPAGLKVIGEWAFTRFCIMECRLPASLVEIGDHAFYNCPRVDHLKLPSTLKRLGREAFNYCRRLGTITLPDGLTEIGARTFEGCSRLESVRLPATLKVIGERAFSQTNLSAVNLPEGLEVIRKGAFMEHRIGELVLPASLKHVSAEAFYSFRPSCPRKVRVLSPTVNLEPGIFGYEQRNTDDNLANPLNWLDLYHEQPVSDWKNPIQLTCYEGSTADLLYCYNVSKQYIRSR